MRRLLLLALTLAVLAGCKKTTDKQASPTPAPGEGLAVHAPTGVVINPGMGGGGSGGAAQAVRKAVARTVNQHQLSTLYKFIFDSEITNSRMPTAEEITAALKSADSATYNLVKDGVIRLTGTRTRSGVIWAYTWEPQTVGGDHLVITNSGVERMPIQTLRQRLQQQQ